MLKVFTGRIAELQSVTARERSFMTVGKGLERARASDGTLKMPSADTDGARARANSLWRCDEWLHRPYR